MLNETCDLYVHLYIALSLYCAVSALLLPIAGGGRLSGEIKGLCLN